MLCNFSPEGHILFFKKVQTKMKENLPTYDAILKIKQTNQYRHNEFQMKSPSLVEPFAMIGPL
jgi:hypothetical protein